MTERVELRQLRYAVATSDAQSFSRAAATLNVKQITLSRKVQQLEDRLGVKLFKRSTRGAEITENGRTFIEQARRIVTDVDNLRTTARNVSYGLQGRIAVGYPSVTPTDAYIAKSVKIESGAKSALDPNSVRTVTPYIDADVPGIDLAVPGITVVDAERTFWDKVVILHGLRRWYDIRGLLRGNGQRISRHYYDLFRMLQSDSGKVATKNAALGADCVAHARMFFNRPDFDLASARPPTFALCPDGAMVDDLRQDYRAMSVMIFGEPPAFEAVIEAIAALEADLNARRAQQ